MPSFHKLQTNLTLWLLPSAVCFVCVRLGFDRYYQLTRSQKEPTQHGGEGGGVGGWVEKKEGKRQSSIKDTRAGSDERLAEAYKAKRIADRLMVGPIKRHNRPLIVSIV